MSQIVELDGSTVGKYRVVSLLGRGGMGEVYDAVDTVLGRHVALKILPATAVSDPKRLSRFVQEARAASALNHPHLVSIYEIGHETAGGRDIHFIAMEKIEGATLRELLATKSALLRNPTELFLQITDAVAAAHGAGIVHRDLKPENIMISPGGYAKVVDFGLAKLQPDVLLSPDPSGSTLAAPTASGVVVGTAGYMSPEQARGGSVDQRTDIFALGCILYEMASGKRAFQGASPIDTLHQVIHSEPVPLRHIAPAVPAELQRIVKKALAKDPEARYQSVREMATDLRELNREPDSHKPRRRMTFAIAAGVFALIAVANALFMTRRRASPSPAVQMQRLTVRGDVTEAAISPDGKYMAYVAWTDKGQGLFLRQLTSGQDLVLVPPSPILSTLDAGFWGHTFSPDGSAIYYGLKRPGEPVGALYRISTLGGRPEHVLDGIDSSVSFSPDGKQITYVRENFPRTGESALVVAGIDGSGAHAIAVRRPPERFAPLFFVAPAWSPDGRIIATASARKAHPEAARVIGVDPQTGAERVLVDAGWEFVGQVAWLPKGDGLIVIAADIIEDTPAAQIWLVPMPNGKPRRLTHDVDQYRSTSLTADGKSLLSVAFQRTSSVWRVPLDGSATLDRATSGSFDGFTGVSFLSDGRLVFSSLQDAKTQLDIEDLKTGSRSHITHDNNSNVFPVAFRNGIAYVSVTPQGNEVCVTDENGEGRRVIVQNVDQSEIAVSRDGKWLVYAADSRLWRMPIAGGPPRRLIDVAARGPAFSPTGDRVALYYGPRNDRHLAVMPIEGDRVTWSMPATYYLPDIRWAPAGDALFVDGHGAEFSNIWKQPFKGVATRVTNLREQYAMRFDVSPDGKSLALVRGQVMRDAVLITGFE